MHNFLVCWLLATAWGRAESGEAVGQIVVREVKEETGLDAEISWELDDYREKG